ncbi:MAG: hypothetical protein H0W50_02055 [Parachlamydiaceae bacterium]|nr:hypothetical protein [Parachlamydiaceae bacterium]
MTLPVTPYFNIPRFLINQNFQCPICHKTVNNDFGRSWVAHLGIVSLLDHPVHKICAIQEVLISKYCHYGDVTLDFSNILSTKEKIGIALVKNINPINFTLAAAELGAVVIGMGAVVALAGAVAVSGPKAIRLVIEVSGLDEAFNLVVATVAVVFLITVVLSEVGHYLIDV